MKFKSNRKRYMLPLMALLISAFILTGCSGDNGNSEDVTPVVPELSGSIKVIGSNTVTPLTSVWAEDFMSAHPGVSIAISGPGSGAGIAALINGTTDICQASRGIKDKEIDQAKENDIEPYEIQVATDALSVVVHPSNPISELTIAQLSAIYT
ncbi:MAG: substrate-binding domain-containing protein, partial [Chloroflexota bacterium]|nr:substrate-binding domain-containing protein [Chloroflexota bacterium]